MKKPERTVCLTRRKYDTEAEIRIGEKVFALRVTNEHYTRMHHKMVGEIIEACRKTAWLYEQFGEECLDEDGAVKDEYMLKLIPDAYYLDNQYPLIEWRNTEDRADQVFI